jgi:enoyl-CoA hydratase
MDNVKIERDGLIATVTLNRPERRNSLSDPMLTDLGTAFAELRDDTSTKVVIVTGAPPLFSAGADAPISSKMTPEERRQAFASRKSQFRLTLACDFRWAAAEAEMWIPEVDLGVPLGVASTTRFVRLVGPAVAKEIILECRRYTAPEAAALGLVHRVVPGDMLGKAVMEYAQRMAAKPFKPLAEMKARINAIARTGIPEVNAMTEGFLER